MGVNADRALSGEDASLIQTQSVFDVHPEALNDFVIILLVFVRFMLLL